MSSFTFCRIALQISEYSMLSAGVPFLFTCLCLSLCCLVVVDSMSGFSLLYLLAIQNDSFMNYLCSCVTPRVKIVWWNQCKCCNSVLYFDMKFASMITYELRWQLICIYIFWLGNHFRSGDWRPSVLFVFLPCRGFALLATKGLQVGEDISVRSQP